MKQDDFCCGHAHQLLPNLSEIASSLKFGTQKGDIKAHLGTKFGWNTVNSQGVISNYSQKITPIFCHAYRVNRLWEEAENWCMDRLTIEPQTFCGLKKSS